MSVITCPHCSGEIKVEADLIVTAIPPPLYQGWTLAQVNREITVLTRVPVAEQAGRVGALNHHLDTLRLAGENVIATKRRLYSELLGLDSETLDALDLEHNPLNCFDKKSTTPVDAPETSKSVSSKIANPDSGKSETESHGVIILSNETERMEQQ